MCGCDMNANTACSRRRHHATVVAGDPFCSVATPLDDHRRSVRSEASSIVGDMKIAAGGHVSLLLVALCCCVLIVVATAQASNVPYFDDDQGYPTSEDDYSENSIDSLLQPAQKRACIRRGGNCDHRPNDCCYNSSCRCNLWGSNCRCQRMGLFQKWG
ncbi:U8-agatoxin-Ao1a-like [Anthonomus grandis grandis]|uniref:U8-agatoxin-Ao1a-like n=1 Tax=Anthonomus grandis grandis TaxID=2921223 RepID=UPI0021661FCC|nr:U8-agatoxin-Ao1a-like [Anthonomus grandis grandis]